MRLLRQIPSSHGTHLEPGIIFLVRLSKLLVELMAPHLPIEFGPLQDLGRGGQISIKDAGQCVGLFSATCKVSVKRYCFYRTSGAFLMYPVVCFTGLGDGQLPSWIRGQPSSKSGVFSDDGP